MRAFIENERRNPVETVSEVLKNRACLKFSSWHTLDTIIRAMHDNRAGAAAVIDREGRFTGLLTEKEILRRIFGLGNPDGALFYNKVITPETYTAADVMIRDPVCLQNDMDIEAAFETIAGHGFRFMPVVRARDENELCGIVSERELFHHAHEKVRRAMESKDELLCYLMHHEPYGGLSLSWRG